jgi:HK97 family phage portal protein
VLRRLFAQPEEARAVTYQSLFLTDGLLTPTNMAGVIVNPATSTKIATVFAAVRLIADSISTLPVDTFYRADGERRPFRPRPVWVDQPDVDRSVARSDFYQSVLFSVLLNGNAYIRIIRVNGTVGGLRVLDPTRMKVQMDERGFAAFIFDNVQVIPAEDMVHITDIRRPGHLEGISRVDELKDVLGISRALDEFAARYFGQGTVSSGIINVPGDLTQEQADRLKEQFEKNSRGMRNAHRPNVLTGGATYERISANAAESQLVAAREFSVREVARIFKVQPLMLGITEGAGMSRASVEQQHIEFVTITLRPYVHKLEEALSRLLPGEAFVRFNMDGLLRGDLQSRYTAYSIGTQAGFLSINDIRRREDLPPVADGDAHRVPLANVNVDAASIVEQDRRISMAVRLINVGFDPAEVLASLDLPPMDHTGLPSVQLQNAAQHTEADVDEVYPASRDAEPETEQRNVAEDIANALSATLRDLPQPVVNVSVPEQPARVRTLERDDDGNITKIVEE